MSGLPGELAANGIPRARRTTGLIPEPNWARAVLARATYSRAQHGKAPAQRLGAQTRGAAGVVQHCAAASRRLSQIGPALRPLLFRAPEPGQPGQHLPRLL
jgi:hypothetical protein